MILKTQERSVEHGAPASLLTAGLAALHLDLSDWRSVITIQLDDDFLIDVDSEFLAHRQRNLGRGFLGWHGAGATSL